MTHWASSLSIRADETGDIAASCHAKTCSPEGIHWAGIKSMRKEPVRANLAEVFGVAQRRKTCALVSRFASLFRLTG
jgi:hypothetical protein